MPPRSTRTPRPASAVHLGDALADGPIPEFGQPALHSPALPASSDFLALIEPVAAAAEPTTAVPLLQQSADDPARSTRMSPQPPSQLAVGPTSALAQSLFAVLHDGGGFEPAAEAASFLSMFSSPAAYVPPAVADRAVSPNPFLTPSDYNVAGGIQGFGVSSQTPHRLELSRVPGLSPAHGATPPPTTTADLHSATSPQEQTLLDGGSTTAPQPILINDGLQPPIADGTATASAATMPVMPAASSVRVTTSTPQPASKPNVRIQTLDADHIFDIVFTDLPSLAWLKPAWINHDLNGRLLYRLHPPHLADVLVDLELASSRYITSRHQKLNIARAIYSLISADDTSLPSDIAAWDRYSVTLPPFTNLLSTSLEAASVRSHAANTAAQGTVNNPLVLASPPMTTDVPGMVSRPIILGDPLSATPGGTIELFTPLSSAPPQQRAHVADRAAPVQLFSPPPSITSPFTATSSASLSSARTRSISAEVAGHQALTVHDPNPLTHTGEVMLELPCGTVVYRERPAPNQVLHYPTLFSFDRESWEYFIIKYRREDLLAHRQNSILIIRRIDHGIVHQVCAQFRILPSEYHSVSNANMERHFFTHFGPETPSVARDRYSEKQFKFNDQTQHQNQFASKLSRFLQEKAEMVTDFTHAETAKWHLKEVFTHQMFTEALIKCFPPSPSSSNNDWIVRTIKDNREKPGHEITVILNDHFRALDDNVARGLGSYHVFPSKTKFKRDRDERGDRGSGYSRDGGNSRRRRDSPDGGAPSTSNKGSQRPPPTHDRGICGNRQHTCSATTCLLWGEPEAKPPDYAWAEGESSVSLPQDRYIALKQKKPHIAPPTKSFMRPSTPQRGVPIPHGFTNRGRDLHRGGSRGRGNSSPYRGSTSNSVNRSRYTSFESVHTAATPSEHKQNEQHDSFYAVARINRQHMARAGRCTRTLMDTGASGMNIIRSAIVDNFADSRAAIDIISRRINCTDLTNNGKVIGRSSEEVRIAFTLDTLPGAEPTTYTEWFYMFDDLQDEMVLGSSFNRNHGFSTYHKTLVEWSQGTQCPQQPRQRDRVITPAERQTAAVKELQHSKIDVTTCAKFPGTGVPIVRRPLCHGVQHYPLPANVQSKTPGSNEAFFRAAPVDYDRCQSTDLACHLARSFACQRMMINKSISSFTSQAEQPKPARMSEQDLEALLDSSKNAARDAQEFYYSNAHLLDKHFDKPGCTPPHNKRYFMDGWQPPVKPQAPQPAFAYGHTAVLQNLRNFAALNDCPARILSFDDETMKYTIHVASERAPSDMRGYWLCSEAFLRSADPPKPLHTGPISAATADLSDMGIDHESGNPTLDPDQRPVHRQFGKQISAALTEKIRLLKEKYKEIFSTDIRQPCKFRPMGIQLVPNAVLPRSPRFWKNSPEMRNEVRKQLQKLLADNVVVPSTTSIVSNVLLVKRPGMPGKFRFTVDLRQVNQATLPVKWCMPDVQNQLDRLKGCTIFGALDISQYYHQIELEIGSQYLTGFITEDGVYQYQRVPMGLTSACAWAQQELQKAIDADPVLTKHNVRNYFDDIPIGAKTEAEFLEVLEALLALCQRFNLKINADKSVFGVDSITHVGFIVDSDGARVDPMRTQSFRDMATPSSVKGVQAVLGAMNYVRHFVPNFSVRAKPLTDLVGGRKQGQRAAKFVWTEAAQLAFDDLKEAVTNTVPLVFLDYGKEIFIRCDSSQFGAGAVLFQFDAEGREYPVSYASRKYTIAERNYNTFQQEASVIVWALEKFAEFFQGHPVTVQSDHRNLAWIKRSAMPQLTRWRIRLQDFDFKIEYLPGPQQVCADGLSRLGVDDRDLQITMGDFLPTNAATISLLNTPLPLRALNSYGQHISGRPPTAAELVWNDVRADAHVTATKQDAHLTDADSSSSCDSNDNSSSDLDGDTQRLPPTPSRAFGNIAARKTKRKASRAVPPLEQIPRTPVIPDLNAQDLNHTLHQVHSDVVGHAGVFTTLQRALTTNKGSWASRARMLADVDAFISGCECCQKFRKRRTQGSHRFVIEGSPFAELSIDILKLPRADCHNCKYVVVIVDSFTRWTQAVAVEDKTALSAARALLQTVGIFGVPLTIRSDGGGEFINDVITALEHVLGTSHHKVSPYLHTGNSLAEKANRSILEHLRNLIFDKRLQLHGEHQWSDLLPLAQRIINSSFNSSIGCSPAALLFGENVDLDRCLLRVQPLSTSSDPTDYINTLTENQRILLDAASLHLDAVHAANISKWKAANRSSLKLQAAVQSVPLSRAVEEGAWALARILADAPHDKLKPRWAGPFRLLDFKSASHSTVRLWDTVSKRVLEAHINDVELWNPLFEQSVEGLTKIAETDGWSYPIAAILAIALKPSDDDDEPIALPPSHKRSKAKHAYLVSVQWQGYAEPSWVPLLSVVETSIFQLWHQQRPLLML
jgi:hypothetical protein